jgi:hypothetical protein
MSALAPQADIAEQVGFNHQFYRLGLPQKLRQLG